MLAPEPVVVLPIEVTASGENPPNETALKASDANPDTKWFTAAASGWLRYQLAAPTRVTRYAITSANDFSNRDPIAWQFQGSNNGSTWTTLGTQASQSFLNRKQTNVYTVTNPNAYSYYRLNITANKDGGAALQLADFTLYTLDDTVSAQADRIISSGERSLVAAINVNWDRVGTGLSGATGEAFGVPEDISAFVDNIQTDRSLSGTMPSEIMLVEGASAAELSFELSGDVKIGDATGRYMSWVQILAPYNGLSPFYEKDIVGAEVTYRLGVQTPLGTLWYPQFIGNIRTITPVRGENKVKITALDRSEKLQVPITHTDWGVLDIQANQRGRILGQLVQSHWMIDHCLKFGDTSASDSRWIYQNEYGNSSDRLQIYLSANGGSIPNVGWCDGSRNNQYPDTEGNPARQMYQDHGQVHPLATGWDETTRPQTFRAQGQGTTNYGDDYNLYWASDRRVAPTLGGTHITFTLPTDAINDSGRWSAIPETVLMSYKYASARAFQVVVGAGQMWCRTVDAGQSPTQVYNGTKVNIPSGTGFVKCSAKLLWWGGPIRVNMRCGDNATGWDTGPAARNDLSMDNGVGLFEIWRKLALQDISVYQYDWNHDTPLHITIPAAYPAVLDRGQNRISFLPKRWGNKAWDVITEVAAAEFGAVFWDETGVFRFWNQDTIRGKQQTPVRHLTLDDVSGLEMTQTADSVRNVLSVTTKKARSQVALVWETQGADEIVIPPLTTWISRIWVDGVVTPGADPQPIYKEEEDNFTPSSGKPDYKLWSDKVLAGAVPRFSIDGGLNWLLNTGFSNAGQTTFSDMYSYRDRDGACVFEAWNGFSYPMRFSLQSGGPAMRWGGSKLATFDDQVFTVQDDDSVNTWGQRALELSGDWYQEFFNYGTVFSSLLERTKNPIPITDNVQISGDPRLQLGDTISVHDPDGMGSEMKLQILGITRTFSRDGGLIDDLTVELVRPTGVGLWDDPQYGLWDTTFKLS